MPKLELTDSFCKGAATTGDQSQVDFYDAKVLNLALRVTSSGKKVWTWRYRWQQSRRRLILGPFGSGPGQFTLAQARNEARQHAAALARGEDPGRASNAARERRTIRDENTVARAIERHIRRLREQGKKENYLRDMRERFDLHVIPSIGDVPIRDVQKSDVEDLLSALANAGKRVTHNRVLIMLRPIFAAERVNPNPALEIDSLAEKRKEPEIFEPGDLAAIWRALEHPDAGCSIATIGAIRLALLTMKRGGEVAGARISEFDLDNCVWEIPGERMKNGRAETVPLSPQSCAVVRDVLSALKRSASVSSADALFFWADPSQPIQQNAMSRAFVRAKRVTGLSGHGGTLHCLRHSGATFMARKGVQEHVISAVLSHTTGSSRAAAITARYQTYSYRAEKLAALETWGREIEEKLNLEKVAE